MGSTDHPVQPPASRHLFDVAAALVVFGVCFLAYSPLFHAGFIWDDDGHVTRPDLRSLSGLHRIWFSLDATQQYYPFLHSAFWVEHRLWGNLAAGYHLLNIGLHAGAACLLAFFLQRLLQPGKGDDGAGVRDRAIGSWAAALLFALHPLGAETVAWISEQKNTLSTCLALLAAIVFLRFSASRSWAAYAVATLLFVLAVLTKSVTVTLPAVLLVLLWWRSGTLSLRRDLAPLIPWLVFGVGFGLTTAFIERTYVGASGSSFSLTMLDRLLLAGRVICFYFGKWLWPRSLIFVYPRWQVSASSAEQWIGLALALTALVVAWWWRGKNRGPLAAILCYAGLLFPALGFFNVYPFVFSYVADHFQYLASLVPAAVIGVLVMRGHARSATFRMATLLAFGVALAVLGILTRAQASHYVTEKGLYETTLAENPEAWLAHGNLGAILAQEGDTMGAIIHYRKALSLHPESPQTENDLGNAEAAEQDFGGAAAAFAEAVRLRPQLVEAQVNWGNVCAAQGDYPHAREHYLAALAIRPNYAEAEYRLGCADANGSNLDRAIKELQSALVMQPNFPQAAANLGLALTLKGHPGDAVPLLEQAVAEAPAYPEAQAYLGLALMKAGRSAEAVAHYRAALAINPHDSDVHYQLALVLRALDRRAEATQEFNAASAGR